MQELFLKTTYCRINLSLTEESNLEQIAKKCYCFIVIVFCFPIDKKKIDTLHTCIESIVGKAVIFFRVVQNKQSKVNDSNYLKIFTFNGP